MKLLSAALLRANPLAARLYLASAWHWGATLISIVHYIMLTTCSKVYRALGLCFLESACWQASDRGNTPAGLGDS